MPPRFFAARARFAAAAFALASLAQSGPAGAADPQSYTVKIADTGNGALNAALAGTSQLLALRTRAPAGPFALVARASADAARLRAALDSFGYYAAVLTITIDGRTLDDATLPDMLAAIPAGERAKLNVAIDHGPLFHLRHVELDGFVPASGRAVFELTGGQPAVAADVLAAGGRVLAALREDGYALARVDPPVATLVPADQALDVRYVVTSGPRVDIGPITFSGLRRMNPAFLRRRLLVHQGDPYAPSRIEAARQDLASIGVFSGVRARADTTLDPAGELPLLFDLQERKLHAVTLTGAYSTDLGGSAGITWQHRNLFGNAEQLNLSGTLTGLGGTAVKGIGYDVTAQFLKPDYYHRDQQLELDLTGLKQSLTAYDQTALIASAALARKLTKRWTASVGITVEQEQIVQEAVTRDYTLLLLPLDAKYDSTGLSNPLDDPLHGFRVNLGVTPTESLGARQATFVVLQASASTYLDLASIGFSRPGRTVIALRGLAGSAQGATNFDLPPDQRFYGGGSATVRGFKYQSIGPLFPNSNPVGGTAIDAASIELRQRVWGKFGAVLFADAGQVSTSSAPFTGTLREGVGMGARYYTPIGPVRLDVAVPLNKPPGGDSFELYIGLGQAF